ncbi:MAG: hypothetical protein WBV36_25080, partial [Terriglobales bacterium]
FSLHNTPPLSYPPSSPPPETPTPAGPSGPLVPPLDLRSPAGAYDPGSGFTFNAPPSAGGSVTYGIPLFDQQDAPGQPNLLPAIQFYFNAQSQPIEPSGHIIETGVIFNF